MSFKVINESKYLTNKAEGFNEGMQLAASRFNLFIFLLLFLFCLKVVLKLPPVQSRLDGYVEDAAYTVDFSADVLAFFIVIVLFYAATGKNILGI